MEAARLFIATTIWTGELHNSQVDTIRKVHWTPQRPGVTEDNPASEPEPNSQGSITKPKEARWTSTQSAVGPNDTYIALDSLQQ